LFVFTKSFYSSYHRNVNIFSHNGDHKYVPIYCRHLHIVTEHISISENDNSVVTG